MDNYSLFKQFIRLVNTMFNTNIKAKKTPKPTEELPWIKEARAHVGLHERVAGEDNPTILKWLDNAGIYPNALRAWWRDTRTPWCGTFVMHCLGTTGRYVIPEWYRAKDWADSVHMTKLVNPAYGCIAVFNRSGGGHVGFVVGEDRYGNIMILGGNQSDQVSISAFSKNRLLGYWWPSKVMNNSAVTSRPNKARYALPVLNSNGTVSTNEA